MYNQHTRGMATTRHRSLVERGGRKTLLETLHTHTQKKTQKKCQEKSIFTNLKKRFKHIERNIINWRASCVAAKHQNQIRCVAGRSLEACGRGRAES